MLTHLSDYFLYILYKLGVETNMSISVFEALKLPVMKEVKLIAGQGGIDAAIKWVTIVEVIEDVTRLQEGEFLITTAYGLESDLERRKEFIERLAVRKLSALAIQTGFYMHSIPKEFIEAADAYQLPLFEIPSHLNFSMITKDILQQVVNHQFQRLEYSEDIHRQLIQLVLSNCGIDNISQVLSHWTNGDVVIYDRLWDPKAYTCSSEFKNKHEAFLASMLQELSHSGNDERLLTEKQVVMMTLPLDHSTYELALSPIVGNGEILGFLVMTKTNETIGELNLLALGHASTVCALEFLKQNVIKETELRLRGDFLEELVNGEFNSETAVTEKAKSLGFPLSSSHCVVMFRFEQNPAYDVWKKLLAALDKYLTEKDGFFLLKHRSDSMFLLLESKQPSDSIFRLMDEFKTKWTDLSQQPIRIGIGGNRSRLSDIQQSAAEAENAMKYGLILVQYNGIAVYSDLRAYHPMIQMLEQGMSLAPFYERVLDELIRTDAKSSSELLHTLEMFLYHNMNIQNTAAALFIHRHTLRYRLNRIAQISQKNLDDHQDRLQVQLAIMAFQLTSAQASGKN